MAFVDLEKAFDRVPWKVIWWALRKLGVAEWIVQLVQGMYANARSRVHVGEGYSVLIAESLEECVRSLLTWKEAMEEKGLRVNADKTMNMICSTGLDLLQSSEDVRALEV